jgi:hypothetical protein
MCSRSLDRDHIGGTIAPCLGVVYAVEENEFSPRVHISIFLIDDRDPTAEGWEVKRSAHHIVIITEFLSASPPPIVSKGQ